MKITGLTLKELEQIAMEMELRLYDAKKIGKRVVYVHFRLKPKGDRYHKAYETFLNGKITRKKTGAVCSHGFYNFVKRCYDINTNARVISSTNVYKCIEDFNSNAKRDEDHFEKDIHSIAGHYYHIAICSCKKREDERKERERLLRITVDQFINESKNKLFEE